MRQAMHSCLRCAAIGPIDRLCMTALVPTFLPPLSIVLRAPSFHLSVHAREEQTHRRRRAVEKQTALVASERRSGASRTHSLVLHHQLG